MNREAVIERLAAFPGVFAAACRLVTRDMACWAPPSGNWSILEIACHMRDEEREDFRVRLQLTLEDPAAAWPALDFDNISQRRGYARQDLDEVLGEFAQRRAENVAWLRTLPADADFARAYVHPKWGPIPAGMLFAAWPAHDALHLRQVAKRLYELAEVQTGYPTKYAGDWSA